MNGSNVNKLITKDAFYIFVYILWLLLSLKWVVVHIRNWMFDTKISGDRPWQENSLLRNEDGPQQICLIDFDRFHRYKVCTAIIME